MSAHDTHLAAIALRMTPGIGVKGAVHLLACFGDAASIFAASSDELTGRAELRPDLAKAIVQRTGFARAEQELRYCERHGLRIVASTDPDYPPLLREMPDYPAVLYVRGEPAALGMRTLSIVGTRRATPYGQLACSRIVAELAERVPQLCIVSGLAFGIDAGAHRAALEAGATTVAVLANALPDVSPAQHGPLAREILSHGGALVTEIDSQTPQKGTGYLARNRIIAGLSAGTLLAESPESGGSLHTAACADDYHRAVMAVPGRITDPASRGTNYLISTHKAQLVQSAGDVIRELMWDFGPAPAAKPQPAATEALTPEEAQLLALFPASDPVDVSQLALKTDFDTGTLNALLVGLELAGAVRQLPGNRYLKTARR